MKCICGIICVYEECSVSHTTVLSAYTSVWWFLPVDRNIFVEATKMYPDMYPLVERLVVAVERISQDVNNISAYVYDLSYSVSHLLVERRENEDISLVPHDEDDSRPSDTPAAGQEVSTKTEYSSPFEPAGGISLSHIDELKGEETYVEDTPSMSIDDNEDCVVLPSVSNPEFSGGVKTEEKSESEEDDVSNDVDNTYVDGGKIMRDVAAVVKAEINFSEELLSEERNSLFPIETPEHEDCTTRIGRYQGGKSSGPRTHKLGSTHTFNAPKTHAARSNLMVPVRELPDDRPISERSFNANSHLESPMQLPSGGKLFVCRECGKEFTNSYHLIRHTRIHTREKPYRCTVCGSVFTRSDKLANHMRIHTGEKPYECTVCGNAYAQSGGLKTHMVVHTGDCPFACENCGSRFNSSTGLRWHRRLLHSVTSEGTE